MSDTPHEGIRPNTRGGDMFTVLLLTIGNFVLPVISYIWGAVRLAQSNRWNKNSAGAAPTDIPSHVHRASRRLQSLKTNSSSTPPSKVECKPNSPATAVSTDFGLSPDRHTQVWSETVGTTRSPRRVHSANGRSGEETSSCSLYMKAPDRP